MTRDDIIRMAREAGLGNALCHNSVEGERIWIEGADWHDELERFAALVAAAEREACAKVCEIEAQEYGTDTNEWYVARACAVLIHSRGK